MAGHLILNYRLLTAALFSVCVASEYRLLAQEFTLEQVIDHVRQAEQRISNIDVRYTSNYTDENDVKFEDESMELLKSRIIDVWSVEQDGMFRVHQNGTERSGERSSEETFSLRAFDGQTTRLIESKEEGQPGRANIIKGRSNSQELFRPHSYFINHLYTLPLSVWLQGRSAIDAHVNDYLPDSDIRVELGGQERLGDSLCQIVWIRRYRKSNGERTSATRMWLAKDRSWIPIKYESYRFVFTDKPISVGEVTQWIELAPDVWLPKESYIQSFDDRSIAASNPHKTWRREYRVTSAQLAPKYDKTFFADVIIPDGSSVYEVEDGHIVNSYKQGAQFAGFVKKFKIPHKK